MNRDHDAYETLAHVYALGALDGDDRTEFEAHLASGCARCQETIRGSEIVLTRVALAEGPATPPAAVRAALLERLRATTPVRDVRAWRRRWLMWTGVAAAAAMVIAMVTAGFVAARYEARLGQMAREAVAAREKLRKEQEALRAELQAHTAVIALLRDPATRVVALRGLAPAPQAAARVVWHDARGGQLFVTNLAPAPAGKVYELWTIAGGVPRPAGLFQPDGQGSAVQRVEPGPGGAQVDVFAITIEPAGGVPAPTGPMVLASAT